MIRTKRTATPFAAFATAALAAVLALGLLMALTTGPAYAVKATAGTDADKAVYTYDASSAKATYAACKATGTSAVVPAKVSIKGKTYRVVGIANKAFAKSKATTVTIKTKKLAKARVKGALKGSKVKKVKVKAGITSTNNLYAAKYQKWFTKANAGKKATVSAVKVKATAKQKIAIAKAFAKAYYTHWTFKDSVFSLVDAESALKPYLADNCARDEGMLDAAPFFQSATVKNMGSGLYVITARSYYTQNEVTSDMWREYYEGATPFETELRITLNKYGLVTSLVA